MQKNEAYWQTKIDDYLLDRLDDTEKDEFETYCFTNDDFFEEVRARKHLIEAVKTVGDKFVDTPEVGLNNAIAQRKTVIRLIAAIVTLLITVSVGFWLISSINQPEYRPEDFAQNTQFESLIDPTWRSNGFGLENVISPKNGSNFTDNVFFEWISDPGVSLVLTVFNNTGDAVTETVVTNQNYFLDAKHMGPGRYYFQLDNPSLLKPPYTGTFFIQKPGSIDLN